MVSVNPRVIAAGIGAGPNAGERRVRFTIALLPGAPATGRLDVDLQRWPAAIEQLLAAKADPSNTLGITPQPWAILASRAHTVGQARPLPDPSQAVAVDPTGIAT
ncbi:MAG: hypothetical protein K2X84_15215, partial [Beijerinckiaceae bacterium]|nr:hypothetical protein [Beijerinckiaceae bacterium]